MKFNNELGIDSELRGLRPQPHQGRRRPRTPAVESVKLCEPYCDWLQNEWFKKSKKETLMPCPILWS